MRDYLSKLLLAISSFIPLILGIAGAVLFSYAISMIYYPAGLAVGAAFLLYLAYDSSTGRR